MSIDHDDLRVERTGEHVRFTWACVAASPCIERETPWDTDAVIPCALAAQHCDDTGHEVVVIRESRQVTTIARKGR